MLTWSFLLPAIDFIKGLSLKTWLIVALVLAYPFCYLYGHHVGYSSGQTECQAAYSKAAQKEQNREEKQNDANARKAIDEEGEISSKIAELETQKKDLQSKLDAKPKTVVIHDKAPIEAPATPACSLSSEQLRSLQSLVDQANK